MKRKRKPSKACLEAPSKRSKGHGTSGYPSPTPCYPVLQKFYPRVLPLRQYLLSKLSPTSKGRRRRLLEHIGHGQDHVVEDLHSGSTDALRELLDSVVVGFGHAPTTEKDDQARIKDLQQFSQLSASTAGSLGGPKVASQSEVRLSVSYNAVFNSH